MKKTLTAPPKPESVERSRPGFAPKTNILQTIDKYIVQAKKTGFPVFVGMHITKDMAMDMLTLNEKFQRTEVKEHTGDFAEQCAKGEYETTSDCVGIDLDGNLTNGQHRLRGFSIAEHPNKIYIGFAIGLKPKIAVIVTDQVKPRTIADYLDIRGETHTKMMAATLSAIVVYNDLHRMKPRGKSVKVRMKTIYKFLEAVPEREAVREAILEGVKLYQDSNILAPSEWAAAYYLFKKASSRKGPMFLNRLASNESLSKKEAPKGQINTSPIYYLRQALDQLKEKRDAKAKKAIAPIGPATYKFKRLIAAWNFFFSNDHIEALIIGKETEKDPILPVIASN